MEEIKNFRLSRNALKIIACVCMVIDHFGILFLTYGTWPYIICREWIGRIAYPIFGTLLVEGMFRTNRPWTHVKRLLITAVIAEPFYDKMIYGHWLSGQGMNILWLFLMIALFVILLRYGKEACHGYYVFFCISAAFLIIWVSAEVNVDYAMVGSIGLLGVCLLYYFDQPTWLSMLLAGAVEFIDTYYICCLVPAIFGYLYDPDKSCRHSDTLSWVFYAFYPAHILVLLILSFIFA